MLYEQAFKNTKHLRRERKRSTVVRDYMFYDFYCKQTSLFLLLLLLKVIILVQYVCFCQIKSGYDL